MARRNSEADWWMAANDERRRRRCSIPLLPASEVKAAAIRFDKVDEGLPVFSDFRGRRTSKAGESLKKVSENDEHVVLFPPSMDAVAKIRKLLASQGDSSSDEDSDSDVGDDDNSNNSNNNASPAAEQPAVSLNVHHVFSQMDMLCHFESGDVAWKEIARWIKYEEKVDSGDHWSRPHVSTLPLHAIMQLRNAVADHRCVVDLTVPGGDDANLLAVAEYMVDKMKAELQLSEGDAKTLLDILLRPHKHKHRDLKRRHTAKPFCGSQRAKYSPDLSAPQSPLTPISEDSELKPLKSPTRERGSRRMMAPHRRAGKQVGEEIQSFPRGASSDALDEYKSNKRIQKKLPKGTEAATILLGQLDCLRQPIFAFFRLATPARLGDLCEISIKTRFIFLVLCPSDAGFSVWEYSEIGRAVAVLLGDTVFCEVAYLAQSREQVLDGIDEFVDDLTVLPPSIWDPSTRMEPPQQTITLEKLMERLEPKNRFANKPGNEINGEEEMSPEGLERTGKLFGGLVSDIRRRWKFYKSDFVDGLHTQCIASTIFLFFACITPIVTFGGLMGQKTGGYMGTMETLLSGAVCGVGFALFSGQPLTIVGATGPLLVFETIIYQLCFSYSVDFMSLRLWVGVWVAFFLLLIVAFDLSYLVQYITRFTEESFAVLISIIFIYEAFSKIADIWNTHPIHVGFDANRQVAPPLCFCTLPSHDGLTLNDTVHNVTALTDVNGTLTLDNDNQYLWDDEHSHYHHSDYPVAYGNPDFSNWTDATGYLREDCFTARNSVLIGDGCLTFEACQDRRWNLVGPGCSESPYSPDVFLLSLILFVGTFVFAMFCRRFRSTGFFPTIVRNCIADFAVLLSVVVWSTIDFAFSIDTPKLNVPAEFKPTNSNRGWLINPFAVTYWWLCLLAVLPALLATILVFLDQQITAVIVNRSENKLKKGFGYHLDLLVLSILIIICSLLGLPWFVAATVRSITHVHSLVKQSDVQAPGERPQMLGVREQRVTGFSIHLLIGISTLLTAVLRFIPMPVLYGVFLYMGITSLGGVQFIQRILILIMPSKYQPDYIYLRHVRTFRVHLFTAVQMVCSALMWVIKSIKVTSIAFPLMLVALIGVRKLFDYFYTQQELYWLDHLLPEDDRRKAEDEGKSLLERVIIAPANGTVDKRRASVVLVNADGFKTEVGISIPVTSTRHRANSTTITT